MTDEKKGNGEGAGFSVRDRRKVSLEDIDAGSTEDQSGQEQKKESSAEPSQTEKETTKAEETDGPERPSAADMKSAEDLADAAGREHPQSPEVDFTTFIISLASSAMIHLGQAPHPDAENTEINLPMAKQVVDMIAMLKDKTQGNLEPEEERYLHAVLYDLRLRFVDATKSSMKNG